MSFPEQALRLLTREGRTITLPSVFPLPLFLWGDFLGSFNSHFSLGKRDREALPWEPFHSKPIVFHPQS